MRVVPELVFVNCCHLARAQRRPAARKRPPIRPRFAAGVADAADPHRRALRRRRGLGGRRRGGARVRHELLQGAAAQRAVRRRGRRRAGGGAEGGRQHLGRLPVLRRPGLAARQVGSAAAADRGGAGGCRVGGRPAERARLPRREEPLPGCRRRPAGGPDSVPRGPVRGGVGRQRADRRGVRQRLGRGRGSGPRGGLVPAGGGASDGTASFKAFEQLANLRVRGAPCPRRRSWRRSPGSRGCGACRPRWSARTCWPPRTSAWPCWPPGPAIPRPRARPSGRWPATTPRPSASPGRPAPPISSTLP